MKKILAVAIATAFAAPAFASTSNVDVYGVMNVGVESVDNGLARKGRVTTGNNSALGFKGSEDLGGGMKAVWQIETNLAIDGDNNTSTGATAGNPNGTRNTFVGLAGGFGTVIAGIHDTPYKVSTGRLDSFVATLGDYNTLLGAGTGNAASSTFDLRTGNTIAYLSPNFGGFDVKAAYVMTGDNNFTATNDPSSAYSLAATYANGPLLVIGAYEKHNLDGGVASTSGGAVILGGAVAADTERDAWKVGAGYTFGGLTLGALYEKVDLGGTAGEHSTWYAKADYTMGAIKLKAAYGRAGDDDSAAGDNGAKLMALGADYSLSKRTTVQLTYAKVSNNDNGNWILSQGGNNVTGNTGGEDSSGYGLNVVHKF